MPVDFLTQKQKATYGRFASAPNEMQLIRYFHWLSLNGLYIPFREVTPICKIRLCCKQKNKTRLLRLGRIIRELKQLVSYG